MAIDRPEHGSVDNASGLDGGVVWMLVTGKILEGQVLEGARLNLARVVDALRIFASAKSKGKTPRSAGVAGQDYLRPAAVAAGVIPNHYKSRFGWHNLRHSLAMLFASNAVSLPVIQGMLRHSRPSTTALYIHRVSAVQVPAQGKFLDAINVMEPAA